MTSDGPRTTLEGPQAELRLQVGWGDISGRPVLHQTVFFDGTAEGFDAALEKMKVDFRTAASVPMRARVVIQPRGTGQSRSRIVSSGPMTIVICRA